MEREKGKKNPNTHCQSIRAMLFFIDITKERNATQKPVSVFKRTEVVEQHHSSKLSLIAGESLSPMHTRIPIQVDSHKDVLPSLKIIYV